MNRRKRLLTAAAGLLGLALDLGALVSRAVAHAIFSGKVPCAFCRAPTHGSQILEGGGCLSCTLQDPLARPRPPSGWQGKVVVTPRCFHPICDVDPPAPGKPS